MSFVLKVATSRSRSETGLIGLGKPWALAGLMALLLGSGRVLRSCESSKFLGVADVGDGVLELWAGPRNVLAYATSADIFGGRSLSDGDLWWWPTVASAVLVAAPGLVKLESDRKWPKGRADFTLGLLCWVQPATVTKGMESSLGDGKEEPEPKGRGSR